MGKLRNIILVKMQIEKNDCNSMISFIYCFKVHKKECTVYAQTFVIKT